MQELASIYPNKLGATPKKTELGFAKCYPNSVKKSVAPGVLSKVVRYGL